MKRMIYFLIAVFSLCAISFADLDSGLVAYYPFNGNANDASGNGNNGVIYGATFATGIDSSINSACSFDGINDYISFPTSAIGNTSSGTISMWVQLNRTSTHHVPFCVNGVDSYGCIYFTVAVYDTSSYFRSGHNSAYDNQPFPSFYDGNWRHIVGTWNSSNVEYWIDGAKVGSNNFQSYSGAVTSVWIGNAPNRNYWVNGRIDETRIYNRVLTDVEIAALLNEGSGNQSQTNGTGSAYGYVHMAPIPGVNSNGLPEIAVLKFDDSLFSIVKILDASNSQELSSISFFDSLWIPKKVIAFDVDNDGVSDLSVMATKGDSTKIESRNLSGTLIRTIVLP